jgi:hypothetical protein
MGGLMSVSCLAQGAAPSEVSSVRRQGRVKAFRIRWQLLAAHTCSVEWTIAFCSACGVSAVTGFGGTPRNARNLTLPKRMEGATNP